MPQLQVLTSHNQAKPPAVHPGPLELWPWAWVWCRLMEEGHVRVVPLCTSKALTFQSHLSYFMG